MKKVTILYEEDNLNPKFISTRKITFKREGEDSIRNWEIVKSHNTVHILVDNIETEELLLVKQVRIPVLNKSPETEGICYEMCAGIVDKDIPIIKIAEEEILEEIGYQVKPENISLIKKAKSGLGSSGNDCYYFSAKVTESDKVNEGGGLDSEDIEVVKIKYKNVEKFTFSDIITDSTTMFLLTYWLLKNK